MATPVSVIDIAAIFEAVLDEYRDPASGLLPTKLAQTSSGTLDAAVRQDMVDRGLDRYDGQEYASTLRSEIDELLGQPGEVRSVTGQELADTTDVLAGEQPTYHAYAEKMLDARDWLQARAKRDAFNRLRELAKAADQRERRP